MLKKRLQFKCTNADVFYGDSKEEDDGAECLGEKLSLRAGEATSLKSHKGFPHSEDLDHQYQFHHGLHFDFVMFPMTRLRLQPVSE